MSSPHHPDLAWDLATDGFSGHENAVLAVVRAARQRGVSPVLVDILADVRQPEVARLRAFGRIAVALAAATPAPRIRPAA